ncbi:MAG: hypothetical protein IJP24_02650, partial [Firmicutes bacterium]|nr:hypothetical protein [Bacillota bacterium]
QKHQLQENHAMALKSINHPCVIMWGFLNECCSNLPTSRPLIKSLTEMLHNTDPTRPVTYGSHQLTSDCCLDLIDVISFNTYPGWYREGTDQFFDPTTVKTHLEELEKFASDKKYKDKALLISEVTYIFLFLIASCIGGILVALWAKRLDKQCKNGRVMKVGGKIPANAQVAE